MTARVSFFLTFCIEMLATKNHQGSREAALMIFVCGSHQIIDAEKPALNPQSNLVGLPALCAIEQ